MGDLKLSNAQRSENGFSRLFSRTSLDVQRRPRLLGIVVVACRINRPTSFPWRETRRQGRSRNRELLMMQSVVLNPCPSCCWSQQPQEASSSSSYPSSTPSGFFPLRPLSFKVSLSSLMPRRISSNLFNLILFRVLFYQSQDSGFRGIRICTLGASSRSAFRRVSRSRTWHGEPFTSIHVLSLDCRTLFVS